MCESGVKVPHLKTTDSLATKKLNEWENTTALASAFCLLLYQTLSGSAFLQCLPLQMLDSVVTLSLGPDHSND